MADAYQDHDAIVLIKKRMAVNRLSKFSVEDLISPYLKTGASLNETRSLCEAMKMNSRILPRTKIQAASREILWCSRLLPSTVLFDGTYEIRIMINFNDGYATNYSANVFYKSL